MALKIIHAEDSKDMDKIEETFSENKFKVLSKENHYVLMKRKRYGNTVIQLGLLFFALFFFAPIIIINVVYFAYSFLARSPTVLITVETKGEDGTPLEFNTIDEVLEEGNSIL